MDDHFTRQSHGSYGSRAPMDYDTGGGGAGLLFAVIVLGAIVLGSFFIGMGGDAEPGAGAVPATEPAASAPAAAN